MSRVRGFVAELRERMAALLSESEIPADVRGSMGETVDAMDGYLSKPTVVALQPGDRVAVSHAGRAQKARVYDVTSDMVYVTVKNAESGHVQHLQYHRSEVLPMYRGSGGPSLAQRPLAELQ